MPFGGNNLPRDAGAASSVSTSNYDVARGGFSGAAINVRTQSGNNYARRTLSLVGQPPQTTWTDAAGRASGAQQLYGSLGGRFSGPIRFNKAFYNFTYQLDNTTHDLQSLLNSDPLALTAAGVAPDSVSRALGLITLDKIPFRAGAPDNSLNRKGSVFGSFDVTPPSSNVGAAYNLTYNGSYNKNTPSFLSALDLPSRGGDQTNWNAGVSGRHNAYFGFGVLTETSLGTSASHSEMSPYLRLPSGSVRVSSDLGGASPVVRNLGFGGNQSRSTSNTLQAVVHEHAVVVQPEQQASAEDDHGAELLPQLEQLVRQPVRNLHLPVAGGSRGQYSVVVHPAADPTPDDHRQPRRRVVAWRLVPAEPGSSGSVRRTSGRESLHVAADRESARRTDLRPAQRQGSDAGVSLAAHRLHEDPRQRTGRHRLRRNVQGSAGGAQRRPRPLPERAQHRRAEQCDQPERIAERRSAAHLRRIGDADSELESLHAVAGLRAVGLRQRGRRIVLRQLGAERRAVREELRGAALHSRQPRLAGRDPRRPAPDEPQRNGFVQPESDQQLRSELQPGAAVHARRRRQSARLREDVEHRAGERADLGQRRARIAELQPGARDSIRPDVGERDVPGVGQPVLHLELQLELERELHTDVDARPAARLHQQHRRRSARRRLGRAARSTTVTSSATPSAISSSGC